MHKLLSLIIFSALGILLQPLHASAHVLYVAEKEVLANQGGFDAGFLLSVFSDSLNVGLMIGAIVLVAVLFVIIYKVPPFRRELDVIKNRADSYVVFTPWMLRLSIGIALIGSGVAQTLISPILQGYGAFGLIQILLGFMLLTGFLVVPAALLAIVLFVYSLTRDITLISNFEFFAIGLSLLILDNERPGLDDILGVPDYSPLTMCKQYVPFVLRIGIGGAMLFSAVYEKILNPYWSESVVHAYDLMNVIPVSASMWVLSVGAIEIAVALLLIVGLRTRLVSAVAFVVLSFSFFYFKEDVASHITLFGTLSVLFVTRGGVWSIDSWLGEVNTNVTIQNLSDGGRGSITTEQNIL